MKIIKIAPIVILLTVWLLSQPAIAGWLDDFTKSASDQLNAAKNQATTMAADTQKSLTETAAAAKGNLTAAATSKTAALTKTATATVGAANKKVVDTAQNTVKTATGVVPDEDEVATETESKKASDSDSDSMFASFSKKMESFNKAGAEGAQALKKKFTKKAITSYAPANKGPLSLFNFFYGAVWHKAQTAYNDGNDQVKKLMDPFLNGTVLFFDLSYVDETVFFAPFDFEIIDQTGILPIDENTKFATPIKNMQDNLMQNSPFKIDGGLRVLAKTQELGNVAMFFGISKENKETLSVPLFNFLGANRKLKFNKGDEVGRFTAGNAYFICCVKKDAGTIDENCFKKVQRTLYEYQKPDTKKTTNFFGF